MMDIYKVITGSEGSKQPDVQDGWPGPPYCGFQAGCYNFWMFGGVSCHPVETAKKSKLDPQAHKLTDSNSLYAIIYDKHKRYCTMCLKILSFCWNCHNMAIIVSVTRASCTSHTCKHWCLCHVCLCLLWSDLDSNNQSIDQSWWASE